jgi:excisionase family DNA binding protein
MSIGQDKKLLTVKEFGERYGRSRAKVYLMLRDGELIAVKCGRSTFIPIEEAERWLHSLPKYQPKAGRLKADEADTASSDYQSSAVNITEEN